MSTREDEEVCSLFRGLLMPTPSAEDCAAILSGKKSRLACTFVVNYEKARDLCARLETTTFTALSESMQMRILTLIDVGLAGGIYSVLRLRTGCESGPEHPSLLWLGCEAGPRQPSLVVRLLRLLKALAPKSGRDDHGASQGGQEVMRILARVIGTVCSARVEVDELKWVLREVRAPSGITQPLLTALAAMTPKYNNLADPRVVGAEPGRSCAAIVPSVFNFDGAGSGLVLPEMDWPFAQEYQIAFWLRVDNSEHARSETLSKRAHLLTLTTYAGAGVDYYIEPVLGVGSPLGHNCSYDSRLFVQVTDGKGGGQVPPKVVDLGQVDFIPGEWHALVIWHKRSSALLFNKDHLEVFLDERAAFSAPVPFPRNVTDPLKHFSIGWDFDGQTSGVFIFSRGADLKVVRAMLRRHVGHLDGFREPTAGLGSNPSPSDLDICFDSATVSAQARFKTKLLGSKCALLIALMPSRTINGLCLDPHNGHHAQLRGERTHAWTIRTAQDVIRNIGGTPSLLPLACYLLLDTAILHWEGPTTGCISGENVDTVLSVLLSFLRGNVTNQHDFFRVGGVEILELLLRSAPEGNFALAGAHTVIVLEAIYLACASHDATTVNVPQAPHLADDADSVEGGAPSLQHQVVFCLLSNFSLWARAPPAVQFGLANRLLDLVRENPTRFRSMITIEAVLSSIHICFSDAVPSALDRTLGDVEGLAVGMRASEMPSIEGVSSNPSQRPNEIDATKRDWTRMTQKERRHIRSCLWEVIRLLLSEYTSHDDAVALVRFMASCDDARLVSELVQMLGSLMRQSTPPRGLFQALEETSQGFPPFGLGLRGAHASASSSRRTIGFLDLVLQRCVVADGPSESLRVAGLRVASVFMARFETQNEVSVSSAPLALGGGTKERRRSRDSASGIGSADLEKVGKTMSAKVSSVFPLLSEALMRDRHLLGESTYGALLEMALLADEHEVPWSEQVSVIGIVNAENCRRKKKNGSTGDALDRKTDARSKRAVSDELAPSLWWNRQEAQDARDVTGQELVLDDTQRIRNVLPLALILQHLPTMGGSVQVRSHKDLLLMLKLNEANRQKVVELSHVHGDRFWGVWERCLFLMMAPLFARRGDDVLKGLAKMETSSSGSTREGGYFMVLKLYAILLEHTICFDEEGYKEIELATSLQALIPHGRVAARVLLAQLAFKLGQRSSPSETLKRRSDTTMEPSNEQADVGLQAFWNNMVHLAFVAANLVSDDVSTVTAGLFQDGEDLVRREGEDTLGHEGIRESESQARRASAAAATVPVLLCSSPAEHGSLALSARVLSMFEVLSWGPPAAVLKLCASWSRIPDQGPLLFPLLRMSLFLLVRLHPCSAIAQENLSRLDALVHCLVSKEWKENAGKDFARSGDMCMVVLAHVHAALSRLKAQAAALVDVHHAAVSGAVDSSVEETAPGFSVLPSTVRTDNACFFSRNLLLLLQCVTQKQPGLLRKSLGGRLTGALVDAVAAGLKSCTWSESASQSDNADEHGRHQGNLVRCVAWMARSALFSSTTDTAAVGTHGMSALLEACMPSLKAAEELESRAVRAAGERSKGWQELASHAAAAVPTGDGPNEGSKEEVVHALCEQATKAKTLLAVKSKQRLLAARQRLQRCMGVFSAAWSPWAPGDKQPKGCQPPGWEISSHKDQLMRQMLLVPVDKDVCHLNASYNASNSSSQHARRNSGREDDIQDDALFAVPALKPSASLLAGDLAGDDEDEEETAVKDEGQFGQNGASTFVQDLEMTTVSRNSEDGVSPVETEARVHRVANQQASDVLQAQSIGGGPSERTFQPTRGTWDITMVLREYSVPGTLYLFARTLVFRSDSDGSEDANEPFLSSETRYHGRTWRWRLERLTQLHLRRFLLRPQAVELFWADSPEVFLAFPDVDKRQMFTRSLRKQNLPMLPITTRNGILHPRRVLKATKLTEQWRRRQISNFQYIMELNVVAGRSYNDVTQYPVFPWVLSDYSSTELDLENPTSFRDMRKPVGALTDDRRKAFEERYATFEDDLVPKFMYGSHYSSAGIILHYLVRQEPFTTLHINLQDGRFDCPDRMFYDMKQCWSGCIDVNNMSDVKELTPEFFYCPEIFLNSNKLPLGEQQAGGVVNDVNLPPWAKDAYEFVRLHRLALESEQVSQHLHHWIDLVFGFKQRGQEAVKAANVFYYLTYEGAVDLSQVNDARQREAMETQIRHFGQTPSQLFLESHPVRLPPEECVLPLFSSASSLHSLRVYSPRNWCRDVDSSAVLLVYCTEDRLVCVDAALRVTTWTWSGLPNGKGQPFTLGARRTTLLPSRSLHMSKAGTKSPAFLKNMAATSSFSSTKASGSTAPASEVRSFARMRSQWFSGLKASRSECTLPLEPVPVPGHFGYAAVSVVPPRSIGRVHSCFGLRTAFDGHPDSILSCGYWDHAIRRDSLDSSSQLILGDSGTGGHGGAVNCLSIADGGSLLVTGSQDATCRVWVVANAPMALALGSGDVTQTAEWALGGENMVCVHILYGHEAPVTCLAVSEELDATVSGASDGRIVLHCLKDGRYVRQFFCPRNVCADASSVVPEVSQLVFSCHGDVVVHSWMDRSIHRFSLNGAHLTSTVVSTAMSCLLTAGEGQYLLGGGEDGLIRVYTLHDLSLVHTIDLQEHGGVTCMRMSAKGQYLLAGSEDGELSIITDAKTRLRMLDLALRKAFIG